MGAKEQLAAENAALKAEVKRLSGRAAMVAKWILAERAKLIVGKARDDFDCDIKSPLPVKLWLCAQELAGDMPARRMAHDLDNAQRKKLGIAERPESDDPWLSRRLG